MKKQNFIQDSNKMKISILEYQYLLTYHRKGMFRNDKMTVKKEGNKFGKDFEYNKLGDVKKELSRIIA